MGFRKIIKSIGFLSIFSGFGLILFSSAINLYENREKILWIMDRKINLEKIRDEMGMGHDYPRGLVNPLAMSKRQIPPKNIDDLIISDDADIKGQWSAPIDWPVTAVHAVLLPNESVMSFGTFGILEKEDTDIRANKKIKLSDGTAIERDRGLYQWKGHDVNSGIDFDMWDIKKGVGDDSHKVYFSPIVMDAFCTVVRVIDNENVLLVGGSQNTVTNQPDTQKGTMIYNIKEGTFKRGQELSYERWYGSIVRTGDEKLIIIGGKDVNNQEESGLSHIPEIIDLNNLSAGWKTLEKAESFKLFGQDLLSEWHYPRSYLSSDGNVVGISHNKIWVMDKTDDYRVNQTGEIPLETGGISKHLEHVIPHRETKEEHDAYNAEGGHGHSHPLRNKSMQIVSMSAPVGKKNNSVMIGKDQVYLFGGRQVGENFRSSNKVYKIDFSNSSKPIIEEFKNMLFPRANANSTILPNGEIFINGGEAYNDQEFSIFTPEIYNVKNQTSRDLSDAYFRRNYHSTSILLPDGRILAAGGDVWNAEIFYPPYLFTRDWDNNVVLAKRPKIINLKDEVNRGQLTVEIEDEFNDEIDMITLISTGSATHAQGSEPKFGSLNFKKINNNKFLVNIPENPNQFANGTYMIFVVSANGVPSEGKIVYLN